MIDSMILVYQRPDMTDNAIEIFNVQINLKDNQNAGPQECSIEFICETIIEFNTQHIQPMKVILIYSINGETNLVKGKSYIISMNREVNNMNITYCMKFIGHPRLYFETF